MLMRMLTPLQALSAQAMSELLLPRLRTASRARPFLLEAKIGEEVMTKAAQKGAASLLLTFCKHFLIKKGNQINNGDMPPSAHVANFLSPCTRLSSSEIAGGRMRFHGYQPFARFLTASVSIRPRAGTSARKKRSGVRHAPLRVLRAVVI